MQSTQHYIVAVELSELSCNAARLIGNSDSIIVDRLDGSVIHHLLRKGVNRPIQRHLKRFLKQQPRYRFFIKQEVPLLIAGGTEAGGVFSEKRSGVFESLASFLRQVKG